MSAGMTCFRALCTFFEQKVGNYILSAAYGSKRAVSHTLFHTNCEYSVSDSIHKQRKGLPPQGLLAKGSFSDIISTSRVVKS
jgi:hypothetical protein